VEVERPLGAPNRRERGGKRRRRVHDEQVARCENPRQVAEARVDKIRVARRDEQPDVVALPWRRVGLEALGKLERQGCGH
jgi:hypothetical protein